MGCTGQWRTSCLILIRPQFQVKKVLSVNCCLYFSHYFSVLFFVCVCVCVVVVVFVFVVVPSMLAKCIGAVSKVASVLISV